MKRSFLTCLMFSALIGASMISVTSCTDYDEDIRHLTEIVNDNSTVTEALQAQIAGMQTQINDLNAIIKGMQGCTCGDIDAKIADQINKHLAGKNFATMDEVIAAINAAISSVNPGLTEAEIQALIEAYNQSHPGCSCGDIETLIKEYLASNPSLSEADVTKIIEAYLTSHPSSTLTENDVKSIVETYINQFQHYTKDELLAIINTAITQAFTNNSVITNENVTSVVTAIIEQYLKDHPFGLDADEVEAICKTVLENSIIFNELKDAVTTLQEALEGIDPEKLATVDDINKLNNAIAEALGYAKDANSKVSSLTTKINNLSNTVTNLSNTYISLDNRLTQAEKDAKEAKAKAEANEKLIEDLQTTYTDLSTRLGTLETTVGGLKTTIEGLDTKINALPSKKYVDDEIARLEDLINAIKGCGETCASNAYTDTKISEIRGTYTGTMQDLKKEIDEIIAEIDGIKSRLDDVENAISNIQDHLNKLITSIELQGSVCPTFGHFALPVGISSNVLIAYYGNNSFGNFNFPNDDDANLVYKDAENLLTNEDIARIGLTSKKIWGGTVVDDEGNAGKLYLTLNPSNVDFSGTQVKLVNSLGEESPVTLSALAPSKDRLTFGHSRATSTNGFYEAKATVTEEKLKKATYPIHEDFTNALKEVARDKMNTNISNLASAIYKQFNGVLDAYAVQATWKDDEHAEHTVTSQYGIAATALKPLGYQFLFNKSFKLPTITPLSELNINLNDYIKVPDFNFNFPNIDFNADANIEVHFSDIWIEKEAKVDKWGKSHPAGSIWTNVYMREYVTEDGDLSHSYEKMVKEDFCLVDADGLWNGPSINGETGDIHLEDGLTDEQKAAVNAMIAILLEDRAQVWSGQLQEGFAKQLDLSLGGLVDKVNDAIAKISDSINGEINGALQDMINNANDKLNSLLGNGDKIINQINSLIEEINDNIFGNGNPNLRLQSQIFYEDSKGALHPVSNAKAMPTILKGNGEGAELTLSSYTAELLAPAYKKFIAVTNVYKNGKDADSDASLMNALKQANSTKYFNEVIPGDRYGVVFAPNTSLKGATYEIIYSSVDYFGNVSQRKYYVKVD